MNYYHKPIKDLSEKEIEHALSEYYHRRKLLNGNNTDSPQSEDLENIVYELLKYFQEPYETTSSRIRGFISNALWNVIGEPIKNLNKKEVLDLLYSFESFGFEKRKNLDNLTKREYVETISYDIIWSLMMTHQSTVLEGIFEERAPKNYVETLKAINKIEVELKRKIEEEWGDKPYTLGSCHEYWYIKKRILKEDYGITWYTPAEENPNVIYD